MTERKVFELNVEQCKTMKNKRVQYRNGSSKKFGNYVSVNIMNVESCMNFWLTKKVSGNFSRVNLGDLEHHAFPLLAVLNLI